MNTMTKNEAILIHLADAPSDEQAIQQHLEHLGLRPRARFRDDARQLKADGLIEKDNDGLWYITRAGQLVIQAGDSEIVIPVARTYAEVAALNAARDQRRANKPDAVVEIDGVQHAVEHKFTNKQVERAIAAHPDIATAALQGKTITTVDPSADAAERYADELRHEFRNEMAITDPNAQAMVTGVVGDTDKPTFQQWFIAEFGDLEKGDYVKLVDLIRDHPISSNYVAAQDDVAMLASKGGFDASDMVDILGFAWGHYTRSVGESRPLTDKQPIGLTREQVQERIDEMTPEEQEALATAIQEMSRPPLGARAIQGIMTNAVEVKPRFPTPLAAMFGGVR